jgi:hypothetical protein
MDRAREPSMRSGRGALTNRMTADRRWSGSGQNMSVDICDGRVESLWTAQLQD